MMVIVNSMKPGICCERCLGLIAKRSIGAAKLWMDLCDIQTTCRLFGVVMEDSPNLTLLEHMGFIITTDHQDMIVIKVQGEEEDAAGPFFCGGDCE